MSTVTDTVIYYLHTQVLPSEYKVYFFRTAEERDSEVECWELLHPDGDDLGPPVAGEIYLDRAIEWFENQACSSCVSCEVEDPQFRRKEDEDYSM